MKFNTIVRTAMAAGMSLAIGLGATACSRDYTADYVYAVSGSNGTISAFGVDYQTGILTQLSGSPFTTQLTNPSTLVAAPSGKFIYVIGGSQNAEVEEFAVGTDGKLYGEHTYNITGTYPTAATVDPTGSFLYVTYTYQLGFTPASPGPGGVTIFPINNTPSSSGYGALGTAINVNVGNNPVAVAVAPYTCTTTPVAGTGQITCSTGGAENVFAYVVDQEGSTYSPGAIPTIVGFAENTTTGALTLLPGTVFNSGLKTFQSANGVAAGVTPSAIAVDPTGRYVYITDKTSNEIYGYQIATTTNGTLKPLVSSPYTTGLYPVAITIDPRGKYLYTANYDSATVSGFALNSADGSLGGAAGSGNFSVKTGPTCVAIDPALGTFLYTSDYLDQAVDAAQLNPDTGQLNAVPDTPFTTSALPTCVVAVPNGSHANQLVYPNG
jgi:6-phosphogluconolactonase